MEETYSLFFDAGTLHIFKMCADGLLKPCDRAEQQAMFQRPTIKIDGASGYLALKNGN